MGKEGEREARKARKYLRNWMIYSTVAFAWIAGMACSAAIMFPTSAVVNGVCYAQSFWKSPTARQVYGVWNFLSFYVVILAIFLFCYGRILVVVRRQARVMAAHGGGHASNTAQDQSNKIQTSVIKTMILVCGLYTVTLAPIHVYSLFMNFSKVTVSQNGAFVAMFVGYIYICVNPFIYATKFDPIKRVLLGLIPCKQNTQHDTETGDNN